MKPTAPSFPLARARVGSCRIDRLGIRCFRMHFLLLGLALLFSSTLASAAPCSPFRGTNINFGTYTGAVVSPGSSPLAVTCPTSQLYYVYLDQGQSTGASDTLRAMTNGANTLKYSLYQDATHLLNFGSSLLTGYVTGLGSGTAQTIPIYPQLTAGQTVPPGTYIDTITASLGGSSSGSTTFTVTAIVPANCTIAASALAFGTYTSNTSKTATSTISVTCTNTTSYTVGLDAGASSGATVTARAMTGPTAALLNYQIYQDSARATRWNNTDASVAGTGTGTAQSLTAYGIIPAGQYVRPGSYTDTVTATIIY